MYEDEVEGLEVDEEGKVEHVFVFLVGHFSKNMSSVVVINSVTGAWIGPTVQFGNGHQGIPSPLEPSTFPSSHSAWVPPNLSLRPPRAIPYRPSAFLPSGSTLATRRPSGRGFLVHQ